MQRVKVGKITAPVGIRGEVRVFPYTDSASRFSDIRKVFIGENGDEYTIERYRKDKDLVVIKFREVTDRNTSETLRDRYLYVNREDYVLDEDSYFVEDLLECRAVSEDGEDIGRITDVIQNTDQDIYEITEENGKKILVPAVKEFIKAVDPERKTVTVHLIEGMRG